MVDTLYTQIASDIMDNYSDVIEGGNSYRGSGTAYRGIAGTGSTDPVIGMYILTASGGQSGTSLTMSLFDTDLTTDLSTNAAHHILKTAGPPMYLFADQSGVGGGSHASGNDKRARKITAVTDGATATVTIGTAFTDTIAGTPVFRFREGFKRLPDNIDINDSDTQIPGGFDRYFSLDLLPGTRLNWAGKGIETYQSTLQVKLRLLKHARRRNSAAAALENLMFIRSVLSRPGNRDGTYTQLVDSTQGAPKIESEDKHKIIAVDELPIIYRITGLHD